MSPAGPRCSSCGALVSADAAWCGQCFAPLDEPEAQEGSLTSPAEPSDPASTGSTPAFWPCSVCGGKNPIDVERCTVCGTSFADVMRSGGLTPAVSPRDAVIWSLVFPGLGHRKVGRPIEGLARGVLFGISFLIAVLMLVAGLATAVTVSVFALLMLTAAGVYVLSAVEAGRLARGGRELIPSRVLMWALVAVIFVSVGLLALAVVSST